MMDDKDKSRNVKNKMFFIWLPEKIMYIYIYIYIYIYMYVCMYIFLVHAAKF